jgi:8-oxo-dGTP pyrophosphatase MutT (NUDIX family)
LIKEHQAKYGINYLFPRGHIKEDEESSQAALLEVKEEAGIVARIIRPIGSYKGKTKSPDGSEEFVKLYLMECLQREQSSEIRDDDWLSFGKAYDQLSFADSKRILIKAHLWLMHHPEQ